MSYDFLLWYYILPFGILLLVFSLLIRKGYKPRFLVVSGVIATLILAGKMTTGDFTSALADSVMNFLLWYIILDSLYRAVSRIKGLVKKKD